MRVDSSLPLFSDKSRLRKQFRPTRSNSEITEEFDIQLARDVVNENGLKDLNCYPKVQHIIHLHKTQAICKRIHNRKQERKEDSRKKKCTTNPWQIACEGEEKI